MGFFKPIFCKFGHRQFFARGYIFWKGDNKKFIIFFLIFLNVFYAIINICIVLFGIHNENDRFLLMMKTVLFFSANAHNFLCGRYFHKFLSTSMTKNHCTVTFLRILTILSVGASLRTLLL